MMYFTLQMMARWFPLIWLSGSISFMFYTSIKGENKDLRAKKFEGGEQ